MFLFVRLVWDNLLAQNTLQALEEELDPAVLPNELYAAYVSLQSPRSLSDISSYERIMVRIRRQNPEALDSDILKLLGWLVCAKRPLRWREIQGMKAIDLEEQRVDFDRGSFLVGSKDLCESLVEDRLDGRVELVHSSVKS